MYTSLATLGGGDSGLGLNKGRSEAMPDRAERSVVRLPYGKGGDSGFTPESGNKGGV